MIKDIVNRNLVTVEPHATIQEVARLMESKDVGSVLVLDSGNHGKPRGIITDRDIVVRCLAKNLDVTDTTVENVLSEGLETCTEEDGFFTCIEKMRSAGVRRMPVVDGSGKAIGIISFGDIVGVLAKELNAVTERTTPRDTFSEAA